MLRKITFTIILIGIMILPVYAADSGNCDKPCDHQKVTGCDKSCDQSCDKTSDKSCGKPCDKSACDKTCDKSRDKSCEQTCEQKKEMACCEEIESDDDDEYEDEDEYGDEDELDEEDEQEAKRILLDSGNPLDLLARSYIETEVERIAILPFSDYSTISPIPSQSKTYWASRRIHDFMTAEFIKLSKVVVPYDTVIAAVSEIRGVDKNAAPAAGDVLREQLSALQISSEGSDYFVDIALGGNAKAGSSDVISMDLSAAEIVTLGKALDVDVIFMGSISDYGMEKYIKPDARTFIPPFLGVLNPTQKSTVRMLIYMYETKTGKLIWASMEEVKNEPFFPLFSTSSMKFETLNKMLAEQITNHFRRFYVEVEEKDKYDSNSPFGGPGTTRRVKNFKVMTKD